MEDESAVRRSTLMHRSVRGDIALSGVVSFVSDADVECGHDRVALPVALVSRISVSEDGEGDREGLFLCVLGSNRGADATNSGSDLRDLALVVVPEEGVQTSDLLVLLHGRLDDRRRIVTAGTILRPDDEAKRTGSGGDPH
jgi:hypothetical protein